MIKAILFDLDGVLIDSEPLHFEAHKKALEKFGVQLSLEDYMNFGVAKGDENLYANVAQKFNVTIDRNEISSFKKKIFKEILDAKGSLISGVLDVLKKLDGKCDCAIVSSGSKTSVDHIVDTFGIRKFFKVIVTGDDVERVKPFPEIYLKAIEMIGYEKEACIAIEDSETGIASAKAAGLRCVAIPNKFTMHQDFSKADSVLSSIKELSDI